MKKIVAYDHDPFVGGKESALFELIRAIGDKNIVYAYTGDIDSIILEKMKSVCKVINLNNHGNAIKCDVCIYNTVWHTETRIVAKEKMILYLHGMKESIKALGSIKFTHYVAVSETCANHYRRKMGIEPIVIHNIIDKERLIRLSKEEYQLPFGRGKDLTICTVSRISYEKGIEKIQFLMNAFEKYKLDVKYYVVGEYNSAELKEKIGKIYKNYKNVHFIGKLSNPYKVMAQCDYIGQFSAVETQGLSPTEARIIGKPVLLSDIPAFHEFFPNDIKVKAYDMTTVEKIMKKEVPPFNYEGGLDKWKELIYGKDI